MLAGKKIIFVLGDFQLGGAERQALLLARHLHEREAARVEVWGWGAPGPTSALCDGWNIPWRSVPFHLSGFLPRDILKLAGFARLLRRARADILMPYTWFPNVLCGLSWRAAGAGCCIWNQRDAGLFLDPARSVHRLAARLTPFFIANSAHAGTFLRERFQVPGGRVSVIMNGVSIPAPREERTSWRARLGAGEGDLVACMVANFSRLKDHATAVRAWRLVVEGLALSGRRGVLVLAGRFDGTEGEIRALVRELDLDSSVQMPGAVDDVAGLLAACDLGLHCAEQEGCPNAVLEEMAAGLPVVATDNDGVRAVLGEEGAAFLAPQGDHREVARRVLALAQPDHRRAAGDRNRDRVRQRFAIDAMCGEMTDLLAKAVPSSRGERPSVPRPVTAASSPRRVVLLADGSEDCLERFAPLVQELKDSWPECLVSALFFFENYQFVPSSAGPFESVRTVGSRQELGAQLQDLSADLLIAMFRHQPAPHDHDLTIYDQTIGWAKTPTAYLFNNVIALRSYLRSGTDQQSQVRAHLEWSRRRYREIKLKVALVGALAGVALPMLRLLRGLLGLSASRGEGRQRILFVRLDVLGDMVLTLPALRALRERFPGAEITVLASSRGAALLKALQVPCFDRLLVWESPWHSKKSLLGLRDLVATVRFLAGHWLSGYHLVLQPVELGTGMLFALLMQGKQTISIISERLLLACRLARFVSRPVRVPAYRCYHIADLPDAVAAEAGVEADRLAHFRHRCLQADAASREQIQAMLEQGGYRSGTTLVLVNVGAGHPRRRWAPHKVSALCNRLAQSCFVVLIGGSEEVEAAGEAAAGAHLPVLNLAARLSLGQLIALIARCDLMVTADTGVMHLAAALNRALVALFGAGLLDFCRPLCDRYLIVRHELGCSGCHDICFTQGEAPCMAAIEVDEVVGAALTLINERSEP